MTGPIEALNIEHWWKAVAAAGLALTVAAAAAKHNELLLIGLGILACGIGEWINRPMQQTVMQQGLGGLNGIITGHPWRPKPLGITLDSLGVVLVAIGLLKLIV